MRHYFFLLIALIIVITLSACGQGAVVYAPTPLPADTSPIAYVHPSGAFQITVPRTWSAFSQSLPDLASATFSSPDVSEPLLTVSVLTLSDVSDIAVLLNTYQTEARPDIGRYTELERQAMGDGSWRLIGLRTTLGGIAQGVNTFFGVQGQTISIIEIVLLDEQNPTLARMVEEAVNSVQINPAPPLQPTNLFSAQKTAISPLRLTTVHLWTTSNGVMFLTGVLQNATSAPIGNIPLYAGLQTADGVVVAGESGQVMGYAIPPNGFMPFSLRFGKGQPIEAVNYSLTIGGGGWNPDQATPRYYGEENFTITSERTLSPEGFVIIRGDVTHIGTDIMRDPIAIVTLYDTGRRVIASAFMPIKDGVFLPQDTGTFNFNITELGGTPAFHLVTVQALPEIP
ncbi:MAG: hypothetical protein SFZ02_17120 [bacterium]|nr:hypothetical protein [bacterium]